MNYFTLVFGCLIYSSQALNFFLVEFRPSAFFDDNLKDVRRILFEHQIQNYPRDFITVFPEYTFFQPNNGYEHAFDLQNPNSNLQRIFALSYNLTTIVNIIEQEDGLLYNTNLLLRNTQVLWKCRKTNLADFEKTFLSMGTDFCNHTLDGYQLGMLISEDALAPKPMPPIDYLIFTTSFDSALVTKTLSNSLAMKNPLLILTSSASKGAGIYGRGTPPKTFVRNLEGSISEQELTKQVLVRDFPFKRNDSQLALPILLGSRDRLGNCEVQVYRARNLSYPLLKSHRVVELGALEHFPHNSPFPREDDVNDFLAMCVFWIDPAWTTSTDLIIDLKVYNLKLQDAVILGQPAIYQFFEWSNGFLLRSFSGVNFGVARPVKRLDEFSAFPIGNLPRSYEDAAAEEADTKAQIEKLLAQQENLAQLLEKNLNRDDNSNDNLNDDDNSKVKIPLESPLEIPAKMPAKMPAETPTPVQHLYYSLNEILALVAMMLALVVLALVVRGIFKNFNRLKCLAVRIWNWRKVKVEQPRDVEMQLLNRDGTSPNEKQEASPKEFRDNEPNEKQEASPKEFRDNEPNEKQEPNSN